MYKKILFTFVIMLFSVSAYAEKKSEFEGFVESQTQAFTECKGHYPRIRGTIGDDVLYGTEGDDVIHGYGGHDVIIAKGGNDIVCGGPGDDRINLGPGDDEGYGMGGEDTIYGGPGGDTIEGGNDNDTIYGGCPDNIIFLRHETCSTETDGSDDISGGNGADIIRGNASNDDLSGGSGDDEIFGNSGVDEISCGSDNDTADGGPGNDTFAPSYEDCEQHVSVERPKRKFIVEGRAINGDMFHRSYARDYIISGKIPCKKNRSLEACNNFKNGFVQTQLVSCDDSYIDGGVVDSVNISKSKNRLKRWEFFEFRCRELLPDGTKGQTTNVKLFDFSKAGKPKRATIPNANLMVGLMDVNSTFNALGSLKQLKLLHLPTTTVFADGVNETRTTPLFTVSIPDTNDIGTIYTQETTCPPGMAITGFSIGHIPENDKRTKPYFVLAECRKITQAWDFSY